MHQHSPEFASPHNMNIAVTPPDQRCRARGARAGRSLHNETASKRKAIERVRQGTKKTSGPPGRRDALVALGCNQKGRCLPLPEGAGELRPYNVAQCREGSPHTLSRI